MILYNAKQHEHFIFHYSHTQTQKYTKFIQK
jgi:hypothetical protein